MGGISRPQHRYFATEDLRGHEDGLPEVLLLLQEEVDGELHVWQPPRGGVVVPVRPAQLPDAGPASYGGQYRSKRWLP